MRPLNNFIRTKIFASFYRLCYLDAFRKWKNFAGLCVSKNDNSRNMRLLAKAAAYQTFTHTHQANQKQNESKEENILFCSNRIEKDKIYLNNQKNWN